MTDPVSIVSLSSVSALGSNPGTVWNNYLNPSHFLTRKEFNGKGSFAAYIPEAEKAEIELLRNSAQNFKDLDTSVLLAIFASRMAFQAAGWEKGENIGINIGSSRGATELFEKFHRQFVETGKTAVLASPSTTLGNISSWVAQDLMSSGPEFSHSVTCSTGLHAVLNGIAWLGAGMADKFLVGGSEAALTPFTIAQMQAMKIYASEDISYPCQALNMGKKKNSMVLGEGAGILCLEKGKTNRSIAQIIGIGFATEELAHPVSISAQGNGFIKSMEMALSGISKKEVDAVVMHAPGTVKGDASELAAIKKVFGAVVPALSTNKWKIGHTFGASGILSLELAILMMQHQEFISVPFSRESRPAGKLKRILVNAVGFGGNSVSILLGRD